MKLTQKVKPIKGQNNAILNNTLLNNQYSDYLNYFNKIKTNNIPTFKLQKHTPPGIKDYVPGTNLLTKNYVFKNDYLTKLGTITNNPKGLLDYDSQLDDEYVSQANKAGLSLGSAFKPAVGVATLLYNLRQLDRTNEAAKFTLTAPRLAPVTAPVRPVQQLSPEILNNFYATLGSLGTSRTSDLTSNIIADNLRNKIISNAANGLASKEAENLLKERLRYDDAVAKNIQEAIKTRNEQSKISADIANKQVMSDSTRESAYEKAKQETLNKAGHDIIEATHQRALYNTAVEKQVEQDKRSSILNQIKILQNNLVILGPNDPEKTSTIYAEIERLRGEYKDLGTYTTPNYSGVMNNAFTRFKSGGKLIPKKSCSCGKAKCGGKIKKNK